VLIHADTITGAGQISAHGGLGVGLAGGGGGGGRVAVYSATPAPAVTIDVSGGATMNGTSSGASGSQVRVP
jgi:hypothetical protein